MESDILTVDEAADYLKIGKRSVYKLAKAGTLPCMKILNKWRFSKTNLEKWVQDGGRRTKKK